MAFTIRQYLQNKPDKVAAAAGIVLGLLISLMNFIYSNEYLITIGPMLIIVCGYYLLFGHRLKSPQEELQAGKNSKLVFNIIFWLSFAGSILCLNTEVLHRPLTFFILTSIAASMIALQILHSQRKSTEYLILFEIILISISVAASAFWVFPSLVGVDPWVHLTYIEDFVNSGHIETTRESIYYLNYPVTHLNAAIMKLMTGLGYKEAMFLGIGLPLIFGALFVYIIGCNIANAKIGLLAALLVNLSDVHLQFGVQLMPTSFGIILFTVIFYFIIHGQKNLDMRRRLLTLLLLFLLIITHTMSTFVVFIFILCLLIGNYLYNILFKKQPNTGMVTPLLLMTFLVLMLTYWMYAGYKENVGFLQVIAQNLINAFTDKAGLFDRPVSAAVEYGYWGPVLQIGGFILIYAFTAFGLLFLLSRRNLNKQRFILITAIFLMTAFVMVFPTFGLRNIMPYRWYAFIYVPLSIIASFGIFYIVQNIRRFSVSSAVLAMIISVLIFFMISNRFSNVDSTVYNSELSVRTVYSESELIAGERIVDLYDDLIVVDERYIAVIKRGDNKVTKTSSDFQDDYVVNNNLVIWRGVMSERPVMVGGSQILLGVSYERNLESSHSLVYSNDEVKAFLPVTN
jgi:hypothetical protein